MLWRSGSEAWRSSLICRCNSSRVVEISVNFSSHLCSVCFLPPWCTIHTHRSISARHWRSHGWAPAHHTSARVGSEICANSKSFFGGVGVGEADDAWAWRYTVYLLWTHHENAFVHCRLYMHIWLLGSSPPDPHRGSALDPAAGLPSSKPPVPTLLPNPGYARRGLTTSKLKVLEFHDPHSVVVEFQTAQWLVSAPPALF